MQKKGNSDRRKLRSMLPAVIVLFISASAFIAGYFENDYAESADALRQEAKYHQKVSDAMAETTFSQINIDNLYTAEAVNYRVKAETLLLEYMNIFQTLTAEENQSYWDRISYNYWQMELSFEETTAYQLYTHFEVNQDPTPYVLDVYMELDTWYEITQETYSSFNRPVTFQSAVDFLNEYLFDSEILFPGEEFIVDILDANYYMPLEIVSVDIDNYLNIIDTPLFAEMDLADQLANQADEASQMVDKINLGVSMTTVASVLAVAMSNRLDNREMDQKFSRIRADILKDITIPVSGRDKLAVLGLLIAAAIAVFGLLWPTI